MNLAPTGTAIQSTTFYYTPGGNTGKSLVASLALEGGPTNNFWSMSCATTDLGHKEAWWQLRLPVDTIFITQVVIFYRDTQPDRLAGYSLFVSNLSIGYDQLPIGHLCFHHLGPELPSVNQTVNCYAVGQYILIYNERKVSVNYPSAYSSDAILELCEVQVYGCNKTWSGSDCSIPCPVHCIDQHCFPGNGSCVWGCTRGLRGPTCDESNIASNGTATQNPSSKTYPADLANDGNTGPPSCARTYGQQSWFQLELGGLHVIKSLYLYYPPDEVAKMHSGGHTVFITNVSGVWTKESLLYIALSPNENFPLLSHHIHPLIVGQYVIYVPAVMNGTAYVDLCEVEVVGCPVGWYGKQCNQRCPSTCNGLCDIDTGVCTYGCKIGWTGEKCNIECQEGTFGSNCKFDCHCLADACNIRTGLCTSGECKKGWMGQSCSQECPEHRFGYNCNETCHCLYSTCDRFDGICQSSKCQHGWMLNSCSKECEVKMYGEDCTKRCGKCANDEDCDKQSGVCWNGCKSGWTGIQCFNVSSEKAESDSKIGIYIGVGTFFVTLVLFVGGVLICLRCRRNFPNVQSVSEFINKGFTHSIDNNYNN